jgi:hypothetical protein
MVSAVVKMNRSGFNEVQQLKISSWAFTSTILNG